MLQTALPATPLLAHIQVLRAFAAFAVLVSHLRVIESKYAIDPVLPESCSLGYVGVDLFFVISGFIMARLSFGAGRGLSAAMAFAIARCGRIYPLYWAVSALLVALWLIRPDMVFSSSPDKPHLLKSFLLLPDTRPPLLVVGWTLVHEMYFYLVFAAVLLLPRRATAPMLVVWGGVVVTAHLCGSSDSGPAVRIASHPLTTEFIIGALAGWFFGDLSRNAGGSALLLGSMGLIASLAYALISGICFSETFWTGSWMRPALFAIPGALLVIGLASLDLRGVKTSGFLAHLGDQSYALYLTHVLSLSFVGRMWKTLPQAVTAVDNLFALTVLVTFAYLSAEVAFRIVDRPVRDCMRSLRNQLVLHR